jgi:hypothetical protein
MDSMKKYVKRTIFINQITPVCAEYARNRMRLQNKIINYNEQ